MSNGDWRIEITLHAKERMEERGASEEDVRAAIMQGDREPAGYGRWIYRATLPFDGFWRGRRYTARQVATVVAEEPDRYVVVTVFVLYLR